MRLQRVHIIVSWVMACGILAAFAVNAWVYLRPTEPALPPVQVHTTDDPVAVEQVSAVERNGSRQ